MPRPFVMWPDARLRRIADPVEAVTDEVRAIWDEMLEAMYAMPGVGLAAPQLGINLRLAVVDCSAAQNAPIRLANPEILHASVKLRAHEEASPNLPGVSATIERPRAVTVRYLDETGAAVERDFVQLEATSVQHQIDHLNGQLFISHLGPVKRKMLVEKSRKWQRRGG
ncbi:peptide deformylase [Rubricella aquisinus]|uniref:Peptide deformylase-like n=1 Tax=Rubricella aquisinus TaxID=2028108 RepID=A0A840WY30_9RHOB|nr:peptide deformylase [Rubricella aquisinus]MBB5515284.1 peptide deformylase [Rubricella aquisinus]